MACEIGDTVRKWREANEVSTKELARRVGVKRQNIEQLEAGQVKQPRYIQKLSAVIGMTADELLSDPLTLARHRRYNAESQTESASRKIPVYTTTEMRASEHVETTAAVGELGFAYRVQGDSMINPTGSPSFPAGTMLMVNPSLVPEIGQYVVVRQPGQPRFMFKRLGQDVGRQLLEPLNPRFPIVEMPADAIICGVVVAAELRLI